MNICAKCSPEHCGVSLCEGFPERKSSVAKPCRCSAAGFSRGDIEMTKKKTIDHYSGIGGQAVLEGVMMKNELCKKGGGAGHVAGCGYLHAVLRRMARRGCDGTEQSDQIMSGVCGHWVRNFRARHNFCPASGAGYRRGQPY